MSTKAALCLRLRSVLRFAQLSLATGAIVLLAHPAAGQAASSSSDSAGFCSNSAQAARNSCSYEVQADFWLAAGICANQPNATRRRTCLDAAADEKTDASALCGEQFEARDEVCDDLGEAAYHPAINPGNFVPRVNNSYMPLKPGSTRIYRAETDEGIERVVATVSAKTEEILGVDCTVVRDRVTLDGVVIEDTLDWFAQDRNGNVWYFGEISQEFEDGRLVSLHGSWRAGVDGAKPGIVMKARPRVGDIYRQEFALGEAEDIAAVVSLAGRATVPAASCTNCLVTAEFTPLEPDVDERKYYKSGIGLILAVNRVTGERLELVSIQQN
jgi:hypothetical protein